jgi:Tfp pilus assembly protein PilF
VSVILDALRRRRRDPSTGSKKRSPAVNVPAGLGLTASLSKGPRKGGQRLKVIGAGAVVVLAAIWVAMRTMTGNGANPALTPVPAIAVQSNLAPTSVSPEPDPTTASPSSSQAAEREPARSRPRPATPRTQFTAPTIESRASNPESRPANAETRIPDPGSRIPVPASQVDHFALALRYQNLGDFVRAHEHYLNALSENEFNVEARNNLGLLYYSRGMPDNAVDQFRRAIAINAGYIRARGNLAAVLTSAGRVAEARAELRAALALAPRDVDLLVNMALVEKADHRPEQATEILVRALGMSPEHAAAHYNLAVLYEERESLALALDHYNAFLKYAGPEHRSSLTDVQQRVRLIEPQLHRATN